MSLLVYLLALAVVGLFVGALARLALLGPDPISIPATIGLGLVGTFVGGIVMRLLFHADGAGIVGLGRRRNADPVGDPSLARRRVRPYNSKR